MGKDFHPGRGSYKSNSKHYAFSALLLSICVMQYLQIMRIFSIKKPLYFMEEIINRYLFLVCSMSLASLIKASSSFI